MESMDMLDTLTLIRGKQMYVEKELETITLALQDIITRMDEINIKRGCNCGGDCGTKIP